MKERGSEVKEEIIYIEESSCLPIYLWRKRGFI